MDLRTFTPKHRPRFVTATALFDGHDASINIMRRLLQYRGAEVVHLGHNRSVSEIVKAAIEEDAHAVAVSSYQGGHMEFFRYMRTELDRLGGSSIRIFGGGGGVITPREIEDLQRDGVTRIYSPEDGQRLTLPGIIGDMLHQVDLPQRPRAQNSASHAHKLARALTLIEEGEMTVDEARTTLSPPTWRKAPCLVLGVTGTGGAGKSSLTDELVSRMILDAPQASVAILCIDPTKRKTGGALLGDRIRFNACSSPQVFLRSLATRDSGSEVSGAAAQCLSLLCALPFDLVILETSGIGQGDAKILDLADVSLYVMTADYGAATQLEKIDMLDYADFIAVNKFERAQSPDALRDVRAHLRRSRFGGVAQPDDQYPVFGTIASRFNDDGVNGLFRALVQTIASQDTSTPLRCDASRRCHVASTHRDALIPHERINYLRSVATAVRQYHATTEQLATEVGILESLDLTRRHMDQIGQKQLSADLSSACQAQQSKVPAELLDALNRWPSLCDSYRAAKFCYRVRSSDIEIDSRVTTLAGSDVPKVVPPSLTSQREITRFIRKENFPGHFPFTGGIYPFRRTYEDPKRQFAGEGGPRRTNARFHFLARNDDAKRLSTAFDSVTLYGADPDRRPDIYGKVGESGVSIATLQDMKDLFAGFDLCNPLTSVSMTINGPAPIILAMYMNTAIDQQVSQFERTQGRAPTEEERQHIAANTLRTVRGTVQADILKEDQAQNTCIFSTEFSLRMMADVQQFFIDHEVRNYYSVSISGYHIAEAGANPITQLALTLANGLTYVEYYLARGMKIDDFAPNLSFFFSNGVDAEYAVLGRVARRIWAIAMRDVYGARERSQKLKYHIQTSGRSLHAQEMAFNDIRTTLQALLALYDNCNSLHTNAYDEAVTTPTEESVRRAMAIQMIIHREFGPNQCENINQGSYFTDYLTDLVEERVLAEFERLAARGGVLGAMETQYQRSRIQEESLHYETLKDSGALPIIGVNTFLNASNDSASHEVARAEVPLARASYAEKDDQLTRLTHFNDQAGARREDALKALEQAALSGKNTFGELMNTVRWASLGQITDRLFRVGGRYRRNM